MRIAMPIASIEELDDIELDTRAFDRRKKGCNTKAVRVLMRTRTDLRSGHASSMQLERGRWNSSKS